MPISNICQTFEFFSLSNRVMVVIHQCCKTDISELLKDFLDKKSESIYDCLTFRGSILILYLIQRILVRHENRAKWFFAPKLPPWSQYGPAPWSRYGPTIFCHHAQPQTCLNQSMFNLASLKLDCNSFETGWLKHRSRALKFSMRALSSIVFDFEFLI